jgi:hypothetical protein
MFARHNRQVTGADLGHEMTAICCADDCTSQRHDPVDALATENDVITRWKKSFESVTKTDHLPPEFLSGEDNSAQNRVQSRAIATAGQDANPWLHFRNNRIRAFFWTPQPGHQQPIGRRAAIRVARAPRPHQIDPRCQAI